LPGALSACLAACMPSACCYPGFTGETCLDNPGCPAYKPHCDAFYDAWIGSTEGVLREVTSEMVNICTGTDNIIINNSPTPASPSSGLKRLRGHLHKETQGASRLRLTKRLASNTALQLGAALPRPSPI
jgi:hypothetical protein